MVERESVALNVGKWSAVVGSSSEVGGGSDTRTTVLSCGWENWFNCNMFNHWKMQRSRDGEEECYLSQSRTGYGWGWGWREGVKCNFREQAAFKR